MIRLASQRVYLGQRTPGGPVVTVQAGQVERMLRYYPVHGETGFDWGRSGNGASDLAYAILADLVGEEYARHRHQQFEWDIVSLLARQGFVLTEGNVRFWIDSHPIHGGVAAGTEGD